MSEGDGWGRELMMSLLRDIRDDIVTMRDGSAETDRIARDALGKIAEIERRLANVERESSASTISLAQIKATASAWGAGVGILASILTAWALKALGVT